MSDKYQGSDEVKTVENRQLGANIIEKTVYITSLTNIATTPYWYGSVTIDLADLNLNTLVPEIEVYMYSVIRTNGAEPGTFIYFNTHEKLPITKPQMTGTLADIGKIEEHARAYVHYQSSGGIKEDVTVGTSELTIYYVLKGYNELGISKRFDVKIKGSDAITADSGTS